METIARHPLAQMPAVAPALRAGHLLATEARPAVQGVFPLRFCSTAIMAPQPSLGLAVAMTGWLLLTIAIYLLNGLSDVAGDRLNGSGRPLASGLVNLATARLATATCALTGVATCYTFSAGMGALSLAMLALGVGYSYGPRWKAGRVSASLVIGTGAALTYLAGAAAADVDSWKLIAFIVALSAWIALASASKDFSDVIGDRAAGRRTAPVELGLALASRDLAASTTAAATLLAAVSLGLGVQPIPAGVVVAGSATLTFVLMASRNTRASIAARTPYRIYMVTQYAACAGLLAGAMT